MKHSRTRWAGLRTSQTPIPPTGNVGRAPVVGVGSKPPAGVRASTLAPAGVRRPKGSRPRVRQPDIVLSAVDDDEVVEVLFAALADEDTDLAWSLYGHESVASLDAAEFARHYGAAMTDQIPAPPPNLTPRQQRERARIIRDLVPTLGLDVLTWFDDACRAGLTR